MRNMSFMLTTDQIRNRTKTVTRRLGWSNLRPGERFKAVKKCMGLRKGEKQEVLAICECVSNRPERLNEMWDADCAREGFPEMVASQFVAMFCDNMGVNGDAGVNRIEFKYVVGVEND